MTDTTDDYSDPKLEELIAMYPGLVPERLRNNSFIPDGWLQLVKRLLADMWQIAVRSDVGVASQPAEKAADLSVRQIKEKFGELRVYWALAGESDLYIDIVDGSTGHDSARRNASDDALRQQIRVLVDAATETSTHVCQVCGRPGQLGGRGWLSTLCEEHRTA